MKVLLSDLIDKVCVINNVVTVKLNHGPSYYHHIQSSVYQFEHWPSIRWSIGAQNGIHYSVHYD